MTPPRSRLTPLSFVRIFRFFRQPEQGWPALGLYEIWNISHMNAMNIFQIRIRF